GKQEINYFSQRLDDVSLSDIGPVAQHVQGHINLKHTRDMSQKVASDHAEENAGMMFVEVIDLGFDVINVLAAFKNYLRTQTQPGHLIECPGDQHDAALRRQTGGSDTQRRNYRDGHQRVINEWRQAVGEKHYAGAAQNEEDDREIVE